MKPTAFSEPCHVECYSGHRYAQEPRAFVWQGGRYEVQTLRQAWRSPQGLQFAVTTTDGGQCVLDYDETEGAWTVVWKSC